MYTQDAYKLIQETLEKMGTVFGNHYGSLVYSGGFKPEGFFKSFNMGNYSVECLVIPDKCLITRVDQDKLEELLKF